MSILPRWRVLRRRPSHSGTAPDLAPFRPYTMCDLHALQNLHALARRAEVARIPGSIVECGTCDGGSAAVIASALAGADRELWLFDSFAGMPATTAVDGHDAKEFVGACVGSEARVRAALGLAGWPEERTVIRAGWFAESFQGDLPTEIALLHIDADWYESVLLCLETFYDRVSEGGAIVLDDFGYWEGCREAFYDFCGTRGIKPLVERSGPQQIHWIKGRTHRRGMVE